MQSKKILSTIQYYQKKYPNSAIIIYSGQRETFDKEKLPILSQEEINASRYYKLYGVVQIFHSQDFNDNYDKKQDRIFLFKEEQDGIHNCEDCNSVYGENTNNLESDEMCDDCYQESKNNQ